MSNKYNKICVEKNSDYSVYYGAGVYFKAEQKSLHYDTNYTISYFLHCNGNIKIEGRRYDIHSGDIIIMNPSEVHFCDIDDNTYHERISICINKSILKNFSVNCKELFDCFENRKKGMGNVIQAQISEKFKLGNLAEDILSLSKNHSNKNKILCICKIIVIINQLHSALSCCDFSSTEYISENPVVSETIKYIDKHFSEDINCEKLAENLYISKYRLEHLFKECVGRSLWDYVLIKRLMLVNELIQKKHSIEEASYTAGFHNYSNFYRLYKKHFNMTPAEYKKLINQ